MRVRYELSFNEFCYLFWKYLYQNQQFCSLSSPDNSKQNGYDCNDQQDMNDTPKVVCKEANGPEYNKD